ncbi:MAG: S-adenosylmethionine:tRNA ribosyltransferase-isomerase, partial [Planctomycetota bacterium]
MTSDDPGVADPRDDDLSAYDYELPAERIATRPPADRDGGRLLTLPRDGGPCGHRSVRDLPELLSPGDVLVLNDSRVLKARLFGVRTETGGRWEGLFLDAPGDGLWRLMSRTKGKIRPGETVTLRGTDAGDGDPLRLEFREKERDGVWRAAPTIPGAAETLLDAFGHTPLPPYIRDGVADETDDERYQTVYAAEAGSVAAPTAGLHFTEDMLARCRSRGVCVVSVTLHVGAGTFKPISADRLAD